MRIFADDRQSKGAVDAQRVIGFAAPPSTRTSRPPHASTTARTSYHHSLRSVTNRLHCLPPTYATTALPDIAMPTNPPRRSRRPARPTYRSSPTPPQQQN
uniref:Uncharacterized protein n=1 Tax=Plectus sambesii TaxID=2011161 RepID=A0A914XLA0_9BILA